MTLDSGQLAAFAAVINEGSFDAAARRLHVTPSAVSQRIKSLEQRLGQVIVRRTKPCRPTEAGQVLLRLAGQVSLLESEALVAMGAAPVATGGAARQPLAMPIAVNADSVATWFLPALAGLAPELVVSFVLHQEDQDHSAALLRDGSVMAAVTAEPQPVQGCRVERLGSMRYRALASPGYLDRYLPGGGTADELASAPTLIFNRKDGLQERFLRRLTRRRVAPPMHVLPSSWGFVEAVRLGLGWGMVPEQMAAADVESGALVEIAPGRELDVPLHWQHWRIESAALAALTEAVRASAASALR